LPGDVDLTRAGQIEIANATYIAGERAVRPVDFIHDFSLRMILSENRFPSRIKSGTCFFGIMRY